MGGPSYACRWTGRRPRRMCQFAAASCQFTRVPLTSREVPTWVAPMRIAALAPLVFLLFAAPAAARPTAIVAMGDSFISGEGGRWLGNGSEPFGTRSGSDRAALACGPLGCEYDPARVYG